MWNSQIQCGIGGGWGRSFPCADELVLPDRNVVRQLLGMVVSLVALLSVQPSLPSLNLLSNGTLPLPLLLSCLRPSTISCFVILFYFVLFCVGCLCPLCMPLHTQMYPTLAISHIEESKRPATIHSWCKKGLGRCQTHPLIVLPYRCLGESNLQSTVMKKKKERFSEIISSVINSAVLSYIV